MFKAVENLREQKGFTLIELLIVVAIIGILAAIAIPGYLGMQERGRKGAVIRSASAAESEVQAWLNSALKGLAAGTGPLGQLFEVDSNGDGNVAVDGTDYNNSSLASLLQGANSLCSAYVNAKQTLQSEMSPWGSTAGSLWIAQGATSAGRIVCSQGAAATSIVIVAQDSDAQVLHVKTLYSD